MTCPHPSPLSLHLKSAIRSVDVSSTSDPQAHLKVATTNQNDSIPTTATTTAISGASAVTSSAAVAKATIKPAAAVAAVAVRMAAGIVMGMPAPIRVRVVGRLMRMRGTAVGL